MTSALVTLGQAGSTVILAAQLSSVIFVLREEFAFIMYQTFSRNDPPGKAPPSRGRSVSKREKRGEKKKGFPKPNKLFIISIQFISSDFESHSPCF
jgi:hypothetical protein